MRVKATCNNQIDKGGGRIVCRKLKIGRCDCDHYREPRACPILDTGDVYAVPPNYLVGEMPTSGSGPKAFTPDMRGMRQKHLDEHVDGAGNDATWVFICPKCGEEIPGCYPDECCSCPKCEYWPINRETTAQPNKSRPVPFARNKSYREGRANGRNEMFHEYGGVLVCLAGMAKARTKSCGGCMKDGLCGQVTSLLGRLQVKLAPLTALDNE